MKDIKNYLQGLKTVVKEIDVKEAYNKLSSDAIIIDIREKDEIKSGSPIGSYRVSKGVLEMQISNITSNSNVHIALMCAGGSRSLLAANSLLQMGYSNVFSVKGGFKAWKDQSLPFEIPKSLNESDLERYKRHLLIPEIGEKGQIKLLKSKILIVGAGGIGSSVAYYLAAAGVGTIGIIDNDIVDKTNLQRQILHTDDSIGKPKVESAKERLQALNPDIDIKIYNERVTKHNIEEIFQDYDIVLDGTDNFNTRYLINDACVKLKKPNIHGSVFLFEGQVSTFWPSYEKENAPCYRCLYASPPPSELAPSCAEAGVLGVLPGMVGILCATEAIKIITEVGDLLVSKLLVYNALDWEFDIFDIEADKECKYCNNKITSEYPDYIDYDESCTV
jgi:molybdopterin/thiamine biosynthesis adenylyltransferase/rhodanese-related sulfurtransferase